MDESVKYYEEIHRHPALTAAGTRCEILERVTFERDLRADGGLSEARLVSRRFDLRTGERVNHVAGDEYELDLSGEALRVIRDG